MKKLLNFIYYLLAILLAISLLIFFYNKSYLEPILSYMNENIFVYSMMIILGIFILSSLAKILFTLGKKSPDSYLILADDKGQISISDSSIAQTCEKVLATYPEVVEQKIKTSIKNNKNSQADVIVNIKCGLDEYLCGNKDGENQVAVDSLCLDIQDKIYKALEAFLGRKVNQVNIKYHNVKYKEINHKDKRIRDERDIKFNQSGASSRKKGSRVR